MILFLLFVYLIKANIFIQKPCSKEDIVSIYKNLNYNNLNNSLNVLLDNCNIHPRQVFKLCRKYEKDCSYYKAKLFEFYGNNKEAKDLYLRNNNIDEFLYLNTLEANNPIPYFEKYKIEDENKKLYFNTLYFYSKGEWANIIKLKDLIKENKSIYIHKLIFYLAYSYIMTANNNEAEEFLEIDFKDFYKNIEIQKIKALILYSNNKQNDALKILSELNKYNPNDYIILKYMAEIYFRLAYLNKALKIIDKLIDKEARDTERFHLLKEKCFMLFRYGLILESLEIADNIIEEYTNNFEFILDYILLLLNYSKLELIDKYILILKNTDLYLYNLAYSFKEDFYLNYKNSLNYLEKANSIKKSKELETKILLYKQIINHKNKITYDLNCKEIKVKPSLDGFFNISRPMANYFIKIDNNNYMVKLFINFKFKDGINLKFLDLDKLIKDIETKWSLYKLNLKVINNKEGKELVFDYYPSSLYKKRATSNNWQILLNQRVYYHEIGHLLGLKDEYFETNPILAELNKNRYIGDKNSIMANILSGNPTKNHIELIVSPLAKCK